MKKSFAVFFIFVIIICCTTSCKGRSIYAMERDAKREALEVKYREGIAEAQEQIASLVEVEMWDLEFDIEDEYGIYPEEAMQILTNYADDADDISEDDLCTAIWAIRRYYYGSIDIVCGIDDYWID